MNKEKFYDLILEGISNRHDLDVTLAEYAEGATEAVWPYFDRRIKVIASMTTVMAVLTAYFFEQTTQEEVIRVINEQRDVAQRLQEEERDD